MKLGFGYVNCTGQSKKTAEIIVLTLEFCLESKLHYQNGALKKVLQFSAVYVQMSSHATGIQKQ